MAIRVVRLGSPRASGEGLRLGTVRRPPRGVKKSDYAKLDFYDVWFPNLAPSAELFKFATSAPLDDARWRTFERRYRSEMAAPDRSREIAVLAALSRHTDFSVGCYCGDEKHCHRSILRELLRKSGAKLVADRPE